MRRPPRCCRPGGTQIPGMEPHDLPLQGEAPAVESFLLFWETSRPERTQSLGKQSSQPRAPEPRTPTWQTTALPSLGGLKGGRGLGESGTPLPLRCWPRHCCSAPVCGTLCRAVQVGHCLHLARTITSKSQMQQLLPRRGPRLRKH